MEEGTTIEGHPSEDEMLESGRRFLASRYLRRAELPPPKIAAALVVAQRAARRVAHDAVNTHHGYRYTSAEAVIDAATDCLSKAGLGLIQCGWTRADPQCETWFFADGDKQGSVMESAPARIVVHYLVVHEGGEVWEMPPTTEAVLPEKGRPLDKAEATALTYSLGYTLRGLLKIARSDDGTDVNQRADGDGAGEDRAAHRARGRVIAPTGKLSEVRDRDELAAWLEVHGPKLTKLDQSARVKTIGSIVAKAKEFGVDAESVLAKIEDLAPKLAATPTPEEQRVILEAERAAAEQA